MSGGLESGLVGEVIASQFKIIKKLGQGGMGSVFLAEQLDMGRRVVVKIMHPPRFGEEAMEERFKREARMVAQLNHPNIVQVYVFGKMHDDQWYLAMEYIEGGSLFELMSSHGALPEARALRIMDQVCSALGEAHHHGVIHRDLKPDNIMLADRHGNADYVKVLDFGIAKMLDDSNARITKTGTVFGTPQYMAPEQARGVEVDQRTDVYALGLILHEMITGASPFKVESTMDYLLKHISEPVRPPRQAFDGLVMLPRTEALIMRCLEKSPGQRFQSVHELQREIRHCLRDRPDAVRHSPTPKEGVPAGVRQADNATMDFDQLPSPPAAVNRKRRRSPVVFIAVAVVVLGLGGLFAAGALGIAAIALSNLTDSAPVEFPIDEGVAREDVDIDGLADILVGEDAAAKVLERGPDIQGIPAPVDSIFQNEGSMGITMAAPYPPSDVIAFYRVYGGKFGELRDSYSGLEYEDPKGRFQRITVTAHLGGSIIFFQNGEGFQPTVGRDATRFGIRIPEGASLVASDANSATFIVPEEMAGLVAQYRKSLPAEHLIISESTETVSFIAKPNSGLPFGSFTLLPTPNTLRVGRGPSTMLTITAGR